MIACTLQRLSPKLKGGQVQFSVLNSTPVETDRLPVLGRRFRYWEKGDRHETSPVDWIECNLKAGYSKTYQFTTRHVTPGKARRAPARTWRITITDPIFAGT